MTDILLKKITEAYYGVKTNSGIAMELSEYFSFRPKGYEWHPAFKAKAWDGYTRLFKPLTPRLGSGFKNLINDFATDRGYSIHFADPDEKIDIDRDGVIAYGASLKLHAGGNPITMEPHQVDAVLVALREQKCILLSPTASGKSLIIYVLLRYLQEQNLCKTIILSVPSVGLVDQMFSDFQDYSSANGWDVPKFCRKVRSGLEKKLDTYVTITTWQSVFNMPPAWFLQADGVLVDEAHTASAKSLTKILESLGNAWFRVGLTGTIEDAEAHKLVLTSLLGTPYQIVTTAELMRQGKVANLEIKGVRLVYDDADKKIISKSDYHTELDFILSNPQRNEIMGNIIQYAKGNNLILFEKINHGRAIYEYMRRRFPERNVYYVAGSTKADEREAVRGKVDKDDGAILIASFGVYKAGVNIKNLNNLFFAHPGKAKIRALQSIGRGLRKATNGLDTILFDLVDDLSWKSKISYAVEHAAERFRIYANEKFKISSTSIKMKRVY